MKIDQEPKFVERQFPRVSEELPFAFRLLQPDHERKWVTSKTEIVGGGGMAIVSPVDLPVGSIVHGRLSYFARQMEFSAEIVWGEQRTGNLGEGKRFGLRFVQISQDTLLSIHDIINRNPERSTQSA